MRLLIYASSWAPSVGGVEIVSKILADGLASDHTGGSVEITLVTQTLGEHTDDSLLPYRVIRRPSIGQWVRQIRAADVIQLEGPSLVPLALVWLLRKPVVLRHHNYQSVCPNGLLLFGSGTHICPGHFMAGRYHKCIQCNWNKLGSLGSLRELLLTFPRRWLARRATAHVGVSPHIAQRVALPRTQVIWNGVPDGGISSMEPAPVCNSQPPCFAYLGRLVAEKGVNILFRASRELAQEGYDFRLKIVGDGPERQNLERLAEDLGLLERTEFTGSIPSAVIPAVLKGSAAAVMPSTWEEVSPLVAIEHMMQGRLLLVSDIGGLGEMVDEVGLKFPVGEATALAACMRYVLENSISSADLVRKARARALDMFTQRRMVAEHLRLYRQLVIFSAK